MDPDACTQRAIDAIQDRDQRAYHHALDDYRTWIDRGGRPASRSQLARLAAAQKAAGIKR
jgi:hypothetical protein